MARILFVGDVHLSDRPPIGRAEGYREQVLDKLEEVGEISVREKVHTIIFMGDLFHSKRPMFTSHALVQQVQGVLSHYNSYIHVVPGNHDQGPEGLESLRRQPLGVIGHGPVSILRSTIMMVGGIPIIPRPYDPKRDLDPSYYALTDEEKDTPAPRILVCHGSLVSRDDPLWASEYHHYALPVEDLDTSGADYLVSGHIHEPAGPLTLPNGTVFLNPGSITRTSRKTLNYERQPKVVILDTGTGEFTDIPLTRVLPPAEVFVARESGGSEVTDEIRDFADSLASGLSLEELPLDELLRGLDGVSEGVKRIIKEELEEAGV